MIKTIAAWAGLGLTVAVSTTNLPTEAAIAVNLAFVLIAVPIAYRQIRAAKAEPREES